MDCKQAEKIIPSFLRKDLEGRKLAQFVEHIEDCPECREELSIQFLVTEGMEKLEEGSFMSEWKRRESISGSTRCSKIRCGGWSWR